MDKTLYTLALYSYASYKLKNNGFVALPIFLTLTFTFHSLSDSKALETCAICTHTYLFIHLNVFVWLDFNSDTFKTGSTKLMLRF